MQKEVKKVLTNAKSKYDDLHNMLEKENETYFQACMRERKSKDLDHFRCTKNDNQKVFVNDNDIQERWRKYLTNFK